MRRLATYLVTAYDEHGTKLVDAMPLRAYTDKGAWIHAVPMVFGYTPMPAMIEISKA
jgi:hypothetical protein